MPEGPLPGWLDAQAASSDASPIKQATSATTVQYALLTGPCYTSGCDMG